MAVIDNILNSGPYDAIVVPAGSTLVGIADRAGYPVLTVPVGYPLRGSTRCHHRVGGSGG
jgi:hypothetical protein